LDKELGSFPFRRGWFKEKVWDGRSEPKKVDLSGPSFEEISVRGGRRRLNRPMGKAKRE